MEDKWQSSHLALHLGTSTFVRRGRTGRAGGKLVVHPPYPSVTQAWRLQLQIHSEKGQMWATCLWGSLFVHGKLPQHGSGGGCSGGISRGIHPLQPAAAVAEAHRQPPDHVLVSPPAPQAQVWPRWLPFTPPELWQGHPSQAPRGGQRTDGDAPGRVVALWGPRHPNPGEDAAVLGLPPVTRPQITKQQVLPVRWSFPARGAELPEQAYCYQVIILIIISPNPPRERSPLAGTPACFCILGNKNRFPHMHEPSKCIFSFVREHRHHRGKWPVNRFTAGSKSLPPSLRF